MCGAGAVTMRLQVITLLYQPDGGPSAALYGSLCEELAGRGHTVTVIAAVPHYPSGRVPRDLRRGGWIRRTVENGVEVIRVAVPSGDRSSLPWRLLQFVVYQVGATVAGLARPCDVRLFGNPALEVGLAFAVLGQLRPAPAVWSVHDVYPDVGVALGVFRGKAVIAAVAALERYCLNRSAYVRISAEAFAPGVGALRAQRAPADTVKLIYDWADTDFIRPLPRHNDFAREHDLADKFVVLYAGNIGLSQGLDDVLEAAGRLSQETDIRFVFVGDGAGRAGLVEDARQRRLANVLFLPYQPRARLPEVLASADVSLVVLKQDMGTGSLPSKLYSILASGRPVLASVDELSDASRLIGRADAGVCVPPQCAPRLAEAVLALKHDAGWRERLGNNGREYAQRCHSTRAAADEFERLLLAGCNPPHD